MPSEPHDDKDISGHTCPSMLGFVKSFCGISDFFLKILPFQRYMPSEPHGEGDIAVELWKKLEPGEK